MKTETGKIKLWTVLLTTAIVGLSGCGHAYKEPSSYTEITQVNYYSMPCPMLADELFDSEREIREFGEGRIYKSLRYTAPDIERTNGKLLARWARIQGAMSAGNCEGQYDPRLGRLPLSSEVSQ